MPPGRSGVVYVGVRVLVLVVVCAARRLRGGRVLEMRDHLAAPRDDPRLPASAGALADGELDAHGALHELEVGPELGDRHRRHRAADLGFGHRGRDGPERGDADGEPDWRLVVYGPCLPIQGHRRALWGILAPGW